MALRWLHRSWVYFWNGLGLSLAFLIIVSGILYGVLQLPSTKNYIANRVEQSFNEDRKAVLEIGELTGHIPFSFSISNVRLYTDSSRTKTIFEADSANSSIDLRGWLSNQLILPSLIIEEPSIIIDFEENYGMLLSKEGSKSTVVQDSVSNLERDVSFLLPSIRLMNGSIKLQNVPETDTPLLNSRNFTLDDLTVEAFLEYSSTQRFIDIESLSFQVPEASINRVNIFGQIFNDDQFLEFNAFNVSTANNAVRLSAEIDGLNLLKSDIMGQLEDARFSVSVDELVTYPKNLRQLVSDFPDIEQQIYSTISANGTLDSVTVDNAYFLVGNSQMEGYGGFSPKTQSKELLFSVGIESLALDTTELYSWLPDVNRVQLKTIAESDVRGVIDGTMDQVKGDVQLTSKRGFLAISSNVHLGDSMSIELGGTVADLDIGGLIQENLTNTRLSGEFELLTNSLTPKKAIGEISVSFVDGAINAFDFDSLKLESTWDRGEIYPEYSLVSKSAYLNGSGKIGISDSLSMVQLNGTARRLDVKSLTNVSQFSNALVDLNYNLSASGSDIENAFGQLTVDFPNTVIEDDTLKIHQVYADYNSTIGDEKSIRLTSTALDVSVDGVFDPENTLKLISEWSKVVSDRIEDEILLSNETGVDTVLISTGNESIQVDFNLKDLDLLREYFPSIPDFESNISATSNINLSGERILFNANLVDSSITYQNYRADSLAVQFTGSFRKDEPLKSFSSLQVLANAKRFSSDFVESGEFDLSFLMNDDSINVQNRVNSIAGENDFYLNGFAQLTDTTIKMVIDSLSMGSDQYEWQSIAEPTLTYSKGGSLEFEEFEFRNGFESLNFEGVFSDQPEDSVSYTIRNVDLERISDLISGRINFSGILDADLTTKSLTRIPTIQGGIDIDAFSIDDRVVGDVQATSLFNSEFDRFDTRISVSTDSAKYPDYFTRSERMGQNITFDGYILAPVDGEIPEVDSLFFFDLDFESIDLWVLPFIAPRVFTEMSGVASGGGSVWGNLEDFDFSVNYDIGMDDAVFFRPRFLDTYYFGLGSITLNRENGLIFHDMFIIDPSGGSANLNGTYDLGSLGRVHDMNLTLEMDEFHFLNNAFDPEAAFFGDAYGSTTLRMTGTNLNPILTTQTPVVISDFSRIGIPLLEETEFDEDNRFIRFVDSFEFQSSNLVEGNTQTITAANEEEEDAFDRTFVERFTLDLQFVAQNPMEVQLIFDPVTGDQIEAEGIGRLAIRLEDEQLSMFGQFDISGGTYQFVSGEIFTRRFNLEPGGTIVWEGAPANANLDLNAIYQARPDINTLTQARSNLDSETSQRVPVELVLNVGGSLTAIENDFFFRLPNNFETLQNSALNTQIAALNRNEDEKLIQAASFLLMGDFIPSSTASSDATNSLTSNFSGSGAVLNPLLSSQVISPLLSNQINSLLRSDVGSLDIDFNLNTYNNVDLAVALRLYNDRIILSREGQITGSQSNIGDIGATYRINQTLSVTAFHRQDPTFSNIAGGEESQQAQDINGVGFEAEVSFNSWQEFFRRLTSPFRKLFGKKEESNEIATTD